MSEPIDVESSAIPPQQQMGLVRVESGAVGRAMTVDELHKNLEFIRQVMRTEMREGTDYGKIPGTGDKPTLLQPGAQKLLMTFNLTEKVKKEVLREYPNFHREYEFTITVCAQNGKEWDGVGTCSTLESKYRYRKAERKCPDCGANSIITGKAEYGGGFICFKKKGGCGAKYPDDDPRITTQAGGVVDNPDPADSWNTVRKMAFKRGLVAASINATNTSELWTQDLEEIAQNEELAKQRRPAPSPRAAAPPKPAAAPQHTPAAAPVTAEAPKLPTEATRTWMIGLLEKRGLLALAEEFAQKVAKPAWLLPSERLQDLPLQYVPISGEQFRLLEAAITDFGNGGEAVNPYPPNPTAPLPKKAPAAKPTAPPAAAKPVEVPRDQNCDPNSEDAPWRAFPMPFGKEAGTPLARLDKKYLFGLWANWQPQEQWEGKDGKMHATKPEKMELDRKFRAMLDEGGKHYEFKKRDGLPEDDDDSDELGW